MQTLATLLITRAGQYGAESRYYSAESPETRSLLFSSSPSPLWPLRPLLLAAESWGRGRRRGWSNAPPLMVMVRRRRSGAWKAETQSLPFSRTGCVGAGDVWRGSNYRLLGLGNEPWLMARGLSLAATTGASYCSLSPRQPALLTARSPLSAVLLVCVDAAVSLPNSSKTETKPL